MSTAKQKNIEAVYPLSPMQQGMLFHYIYNPESATYFEQFSCKLEGNLNKSAFEKAWQLICQRHSILRSSFVWKKLDKMLQVVQKSIELPVIYEDWRAVNPDLQKDKLEAFFESDRKKGFNLSKAPLMRFYLVQLSDTKYQFLWSFHHLLTDGWSIPIILKEVFTAYEMLNRDMIPRFSPARPYRDYISWLQKQDMQKAEAYWRELLKDFSAPTPITVEQVNTGTQKRPDEYPKIFRHISKPVSERLFALARQNQLTANTIVQGAWALLLSRYSREEDILFGATVSGRPPQLNGVESMVGLFINTLPVRISVNDDIAAIDWLKNIQKQAIETRDFEYTPLVDIQGWSSVPRELPLFNSIVVFENYPVDSSMKEQKTSFEVSDVKSYERTNYPLTFVAASSDVLTIEIAYDTSRFDPDTIRRMLDHLNTILNAIAKDPQQKLAAIPLLSQEEKDHIIHQQVSTDRQFGQPLCIHEKFEEIVSVFPENTALVFENQQWTYAELNARANQLARYLLRKGIGKEAKIAVSIDRSPEMIVSILGALKAGAAYIPMDPDYPKDRLAYMQDDSGAQLLITKKSLLGHLPDSRPDTLLVDDEWPAISAEADTNTGIHAEVSTLAYIIYTSGSTGKPKGVMVQHQGLLNLTAVMKEDFKIDPVSRILQFASFSFDASVSDIFMTLLNGASLYLIERETILSTDKLKEFFNRHKISTCILTPSLLAILDEADFPALKTVISAGEAISWDVAASWANNHMFINAYGPTEATIGTNWKQVTADEPRSSKTPPIGPSIANVRTYILDDKLDLCPLGVPGEIVVGGNNLARGYLNRPELSAEKFVPDPFNGVAGSRMYRTGDLGRLLPDGNLEFIGRIDNQVKLRGFRIELGEIEAVLTTHPSIKDAAVILREDSPGNKYLAGYIIKADETEKQALELQTFLNKHLPEHMVPAVFVEMETFPQTPNGKVNRKALPLPDEAELDQGLKIAPRTPVEDLLVTIWSRILKNNNIGINESFFDLGGHSLMATQMVSRIRDAFGVELPLRDFFETPFISELALKIEQLRLTDQSLSAPPIERTARDTHIPVSFAQQRLWFLDQLSPGNANYNIPAVLELQGELNIDALERSINRLIERHESLRTTFSNVRGEAVQIISEKLTFHLQVQDLSELENNERQEKARRMAVDEAMQAFDLEHGPLFRSKLLKLGNDSHLVLFTLHHSISDGWSMGVLVEEIAALYSAFLQDQPDPLNELPVQYADYAVWQRDWLKDKVLEKQLNFWKEYIGLNPAVLELPTDRPRPAMQTFNGRTLQMTIPPELSAQIKQLSQKEGTTLFMTLLAAFQVLLHRYSGQDNILVGSPIANRTQSELEKLIGFFVNTLVFKSNFNEDTDYKTLLKQTRENTLQAYAHQDLPFEQLVEALQPDRDMSHSPLFQVAFILQNTPLGDLELPGLTIKPFESENKTSKYDLTLNTADSDQGILCYFEFNTDLFDDATIRRLQEHYRIILTAMVENLKQNVSRTELLTAQEKQWIFSDWNNTAKPFPDQATVHELFRDWVRKQPQQEALRFANESLTYSELDQRSDQLAAYLLNQGLKTDQLVGISMHRSLDVPVSILAILKAGGAFLAIDPTYPADRTEYMIKDSGIKLLLSQSDLAEQLPLSSLKTICLDRDWPLISQQNGPLDGLPLSAENLAYVIYTSGSTGRPKGTALAHRGLCNLSRAQCRAFDISGQKRILQFAPLSFDASVWETMMALLNGATLILSDQESLTSGQGLAEVLIRDKVTTVTLPPSVLAVLPEQDFPELKTIVTAGEKCTVDLISRWGNGRQFVNAYGPTETTVCASMFETDGRPDIAPPIGKPIDNFQLYVLDRNLQQVPVGIPGELCIAGAGLARGYLKRPELTASAFIPNPYSKERGARLYRSGDLARFLPDGNIEFLGRIDHQVKVRGFRIEPGEIETTLGELSSVNNAVVLAREDSPGSQQLVAYVVGDGRDSLNAGAFREHLRAHLPEYMVPAAFVVLDEMPLTPNGKVDRKALPAPEISRDDLMVEYVAPRNESEQLLADIVKELLKIEKVGIHDNFFDLGGHSLLATQFISRIRESLGVEIPLRKLFEQPTVAALAEVALGPDARAAEEIPQIERLERGEQNLDDLLSELGDLSDEEVKALLSDDDSE